MKKAAVLAVPFNPDEVAASAPTAQDFVDRILGSSVTSSGYAEHFVDNFTFFGRSLEEWATELQVSIPEHANLHDIKGLWIQLANNIQIAGHFKATSVSIYNAMASGIKIQKDDIITSLVTHYVNANLTRPAAKVLEAMADSYMKDSTVSKESAKLCKDFWNQKYDSLVEVRKSLEQLLMTIITENKYAGTTDELD